MDKNNKAVFATISVHKNKKIIVTSDDIKTLWNILNKIKNDTEFIKLFKVNSNTEGQENQRTSLLTELQTISNIQEQIQEFSDF